MSSGPQNSSSRRSNSHTAVSRAAGEGRIPEGSSNKMLPRSGTHFTYIILMDAMWYRCASPRPRAVAPAAGAALVQHAIACAPGGGQRPLAPVA